MLVGPLSWARPRGLVLFGPLFWCSLSLFPERFPCRPQWAETGANRRAQPRVEVHAFVLLLRVRNLVVKVQEALLLFEQTGALSPMLEISLGCSSEEKKGGPGSEN